MLSILAGMLLGIAGSLHCVGMCGPLILILPFQSESKLQGILQTILYHFGRVIAYVFLGLLFGMVFQIVDLKYFEQYFSLAIGLMFLVLWGREQFGTKSSNQGTIYKFVITMFGKAMRIKSVFGLFLAGAMNGLLPCGLVYGALLAAFGTGTTLGSIQFMLGFGTATIPAMVIVFFAKSLISSQMRLSLSRLLPWWLLILGIWFLLRGSNLGIPFVSPKIHTQHGVHSSCCKPMSLD